MMVNSITTDLGLEPLATPTFWHRLMHENEFRIFVMFKMRDGDLARTSLWTLREKVISSSMYMETRLRWKLMTLAHSRTVFQV